MDSLEVTADTEEFNLLKDNNNVVFIKMDDVSLRGAMDLVMHYFQIIRFY